MLPVRCVLSRKWEDNRGWPRDLREDRGWPCSLHAGLLMLAHLVSRKRKDRGWPRSLIWKRKDRGLISISAGYSFAAPRATAHLLPVRCVLSRKWEDDRGLPHGLSLSRKREDR